MACFINKFKYFCITVIHFNLITATMKEKFYNLPQLLTSPSKKVQIIVTIYLIVSAAYVIGVSIFMSVSL